MFINNLRLQTCCTQTVLLEPSSGGLIGLRLIAQCKQVVNKSGFNSSELYQRQDLPHIGDKSWRGGRVKYFTNQYLLGQPCPVK